MIDLPILWWTSLTLAFLAGGAAGLLAGRSLLAGKLKKRRDEMSADCVAIALLAADVGDHARALEWFRHARNLAPANARLAAQEAWCLGELGRIEEAIQAYREAAFFSEDGMADFDAALLLLRSGGAHGHAEAHLTAALARTPELALEARGVDEFRVLRGRAGYEAAMADALARAPRPRRRG